MRIWIRHARTRFKFRVEPRDSHKSRSLQLGKGMFFFMKSQREYFENAAKLSVVMDDFYNGKYKREWEARARVGSYPRLLSE